MNDPIDCALERLRTAPDNGRLDRLEAGVWTRIDGQRGDIFSGKTLQVQLAVSCVALLLGVFIAKLAGVDMMPMPISSELVVLSDDSAVVPSVLLEGGI